MFIPFLASITAGAIAAWLIQLGAMSVWVTVLSVAIIGSFAGTAKGVRPAAGQDVLGMPWGCGEGGLGGVKRFAKRLSAGEPIACLNPVDSP